LLRSLSKVRRPSLSFGTGSPPKKLEQVPNRLTRVSLHAEARV